MVTLIILYVCLLQYHSDGVRRSIFTELPHRDEIVADAGRTLNVSSWAHGDPRPEEPRVKNPRFSLEEVITGEYEPRLFNGSWISVSGYQDLSDFERGVIIRARDMGHSISEVAMKFGFSRTTISRMYREYRVSGKTSNFCHLCGRKNDLERTGPLTSVANP
ncbi:hypothetical protein AVEN_281-1 [Araneus ventricosus]|uniref:Tc3 transposase DNA binding domain-containing protein n=1 Tax=Araneus ventricosus TaxID=182803 RepID=A0A4Y2CNS1_ARAVE|nr:hypothetical protein AVEN_281-1 [Araneus ventricosus]